LLGIHLVPLRLEYNVGLSLIAATHTASLQDSNPVHEASVLILLHHYTNTYLVIQGYQYRRTRSVGPANVKNTRKKLL
jgi:hypothetical protein